MKKLLFIITLIFSTAVLAKAGDSCNPGAEVLEKAALTLAQINNPEGELTAKLDTSRAASPFRVIIDDNYGLYDMIILTEETSNGFCRIKSITEL